jgi:hypothetical protein
MFVDPSGTQIVEVAGRLVDVSTCGGREAGAERADVGREVDDAEAVLGAERREHLTAGSARLFHLLPTHGARHVDDERQIARRRTCAIAGASR